MRKPYLPPGAVGTEKKITTNHIIETFKSYTTAYRFDVNKNVTRKIIYIHKIYVW